MSTSGEQGKRPLTRRELRELRAKGGEPAVREALDAAAAEDPPAEPAPSPHVVASVPHETEEPRPLTRKELRRLRTNEVPIVSADGVVGASDDRSADAADAGERHPQSLDAVSASEEADDEAAATAAPETPEDPTSGEVAEDRSSKADEPGERGAGDETSDEEPAAGDDEPTAREDAEETADGEPSEEPESAADARAGGERSDEDDASSDDAPDDAASSHGSDGASHETPALSPTFGAGVGERGGEPEAASFDDLMEQYATTSPSSIIMTSSHRLPEGLGSQGAAKGTTDGREADAVLIDGELPASSSPTPIAASSAISTQKSAHEVLRPPAPEKGRGLLFTLGITAGILGIVAVGTLVTLYFTGVFNQ